MKLIRLLLQNSWAIVTFAAITGLLSGASSAGLIALINFTLKNFALAQASLAWSFVGLCCLLLVTSAISLVLVARLAQEIVFNLQMGLTSRILSCPLRQLETVGSPRLLAALTEDVEAVSTASFSVSALCVNVALLGGCLIYLSWLSISVFFFFIGFLFLGVFSYQSLVKRGRFALKLAREAQDRLFQHFRTTTEGTKELKLHRSRRIAFLTQDLQLTAESFREHRVKGMTIFAIASGWGLVLFFIPIGLLIFALPQITTLSVSVLSGYALTIVFMITPLRGILNTLPELAKADVALDKIESLGLSLAAIATEQEPTNPLELKPNWSSLKLVGATHAYPVEREDSKFILGPIDLSFDPGLRYVSAQMDSSSA
ncbi:MAG: ABC transporter transmembrane domain-containing protein [Cyanobacteriota bacterium]